MKDINEYKKQHERYDIGHACQAAFYCGYFCARYEEQITAFNALSNRSVSVDSDGIRLNGATRQEVLDFLKIFGGKWNKTPSEYYKDKIDYTQAIETPFDSEYQTFSLQVSQAEPPPSCVIEEYEELVPAQVVKKKRMVCPKPALDDANSVAEITEVAPIEEVVA